MVPELPHAPEPEARDDAALRKVNIGETLELNYNYDADGKRQLSDAEYQNRMHEDIRASLVANVYLIQR